VKVLRELPPRFARALAKIISYFVEFSLAQFKGDPAFLF